MERGQRGARGATEHVKCMKYATPLNKRIPACGMVVLDDLLVVVKDGADPLCDRRFLAGDKLE
jgi:hypothetical protein